MKSVHWRTGLFHADGQTDIPTDRRTDMTKLIVTFRSFTTVPVKDNVVFCSFF
jgi:hypothetical protein